MSDAGGPSGGTSLTLLQRLRANKPDAWREMVYLYSPLVYGWCARLGVRGADADDVSQEVFRAATAGLAGFRRERAGDTFRGWLRGITRNMVLAHLRGRDRRPQGSGDTDVLRQMQEVVDPASLPADEDDPPGDRDALYRRALELVRREFEERTWRAFWQTVAEGRSPVDVAADLGATPAAVRKAKSRVLHRLKEQFGDLIL
jgi:RNA polymerase sigma-70 factor (ECF subfamily)